MGKLVGYSSYDIQFTIILGLKVCNCSAVQHDHEINNTRADFEQLTCKRPLDQSTQGYLVDFSRVSRVTCFYTYMYSFHICIILFNMCNWLSVCYLY